jgi:hypothetical protein
MASRRARDFDRWVRLSLRPGVGGLYVDYGDETGDRLTAPPLQKDARGRRLTLWPNTPRQLPHGLEARLRSGFADRPEERPHYLPDRRFLERQVPWLLPVFVEPPPGAAPGLPWEDWLAADILNTPELAGRCVLMRHVPLSWRPVLQLPLRFEQLGLGTADWFSAARARRWYTGSAAVRQFGLQFANPGDRSPSGKAQVIVRPFGTELPAWLLSQPSSMPLLVVTIAETYLSGAERSAPPPEPGLSHLFVHPHDPATTLNASAVVEQIVYALVHDFALHEIAWILAHAMPEVWTWIASDPGGIQALRLSAVMRRTIDAALAGSGPSGSSFMIGNSRLHERLLRLDGDFRFESRGLTGIAQWLQEAQDWRRPARERGRRESYPPEPRKADIAIERYDAFGVLSPMLRGDRLAPLVRGWRYRLRIHVGIPDRVASAVVGEVPSVDELMPAPQGDQPRPIEVAIFTKRFELLSDDVRVILLPARGASAPVYFEVRAPQQIGPADLRIALYWQNNLLQSFVLEAEVGDGMARDAKSPSERVRVRLDSSGVADFTTLPQVQGRALSVAFNDDAGAGTHTVMMKGKDWRQELSLSAADTESYTKDFHSVLAAAGGPVTFDATLREMARIGNRIWRQLLALRDRSTDGAVEALRVSSGATVQFMRHGGGTPFPWQTVYDYGLAQGPDYRKASICDASKPVRGPFPRGRVGCPHCPGENVICIEGFWAARHRIELLAERLIGEAAGPPRARRASAPPANPLVTLGIGTPGGVTLRFAQALKRSLGTALHRIEPKDAPVTDHVWDKSKRPAILAIVSHLEAGSAQDNLPTRVRAFSPSADGDAISDAELSDRIGGWEEPQRPLVLLLACGSARKRLGELTSLVDALLIVGAAGVAGTEWDVDAERATRFGSWIIDGMLDATKPQRLGEVVRGYVHQALREGDALPFVFTVYGDADLTAGRVQS